MPPRRRAAGKRRGRKPLRKPRQNRSKAGARSVQSARIVETIEFKNMTPNYVAPFTFSINQFERARTLATNFRWMKATKVTWAIEPQFNTYQGSTIGAQPTIPYVYTLMNRTQDSAGMTLSDMLSCGCKPVKLTNLKKLTYKPNWCSPGLLAQNVLSGPGFGGYLNNVVFMGLKAEYGWLQAPNVLPANTNPPQIPPTGTNHIQPIPPVGLAGEPFNQSTVNIASDVLYNGHQVYIEQQGVAAQTQYRVTCTVHWSFKDPKNVLASGTDNQYSDISGAVPIDEKDA